MSSPTEHDLLSLLACPRCRGPLVAQRQTHACAACALEFPVVGKLPWLYQDPDAKLAEWQNLVSLGLGDMRRHEERLKAAQRQTGLKELTLKRLRLELQARVEHRKAVEGLLEPLMRLETDTVEVLRVLSRKAAATQSLGSYEINAVRDWGWPETEENRLALELVLATLDEPAASRSSIKTIAVLGGGACRLPYDLHRALKPAATVVVDINPFLLFAAERLLAGKTLTVAEFPLAPDGLTQTAVMRRLAAPAKVDGMHLIFGDVLAAPLALERFDLVLTPWLVDILPEGPERFLPRVNRLLKPGGRWLNFGSVAFQHPAPERQLSREELLDSVVAAGFRIDHQRQDRLPYLASPASCQARHETVLTFAATKVATAAEPQAHQPLPAWLLDASRPAPKTEHFANLQAMHAYYAEVLALIDGQRSIAEVARLIATKYGLGEAETRQAVVGFLANLHELAR